MPKYSQTLTANSFTVQDISTRFKEAMDNLGWGTGKVDISGGYRFTAAEETNSTTTPLSVQSTSFVDNYQGKNIIYSAKDRRSFSVVAAYLPGVKSYRLKYTPKRFSGAATSITWSETENDFGNHMLGFCLSTGIPVEDNNSRMFGYNAISVNLGLASVPNTPGTQYTTPWVGSGNIAGYPSIAISINDPDVYIEINAVEYTVTQNKFAFQSPNLDSPTFEVNVLNGSGNALSTLTTLPIKNAKVPLVRVGNFPTLNNTIYRYTNLFDAHITTLYNTHPDSSTVGSHLQRTNSEIMVWGSFGQDLAIIAGSNTQYDGFYLLTSQGGNWNGAIWDTVNKSSAFPNTTPQFPAIRRTSVESTKVYGRNTYNPYGSSTSQNWNTGRLVNNHLFEVKNVSTIQEVQAVQDMSDQGIGDDGFFHKISFAISKVQKTADGVYKVTEIVKKGDVSTKPFQGNVRHVLPVGFEFQPGLYCISTSTDRYRTWYADGDYANEYMDLSLLNIHRSRDINYLTSLGRLVIPADAVPATISGVRYIRDTMSGSSANGGNHWVEIQALKGGSNLALGKPVTYLGTSQNSPVSVVTDGDASNTNVYFGSNLATEALTVDLGSVQTVDTLKIWHYYGDGRSYNSVVEVSEDGVVWKTVFQGSYPETSAGKSHALTYPFAGTAPATAVDLFDVNTVAVNYEIKAGTNLINPNMKIRIVQSGSGTPVNLKTSFAENWFTYGKLGSFNPGTFRLNKVDRAIGSTGNYYWGNYDNILINKFPFGLDLQMLAWSMEEYFSSPNPSAVYRIANNELHNYINHQSVEFGKQTSKFADGRPYRKMWASSIWGTSLQANNLFLLNGLTNMNTSYVTSQDGREYVTVITSNTGSSKQSYAFRLR